MVVGGAKGVSRGKASDERGTRRACLWQIGIMGTLGGGMGNAPAPMQHQDSLGGASVGRRTSFAQRVWAVAGARSVVQPSAVSSSPRAGLSRRKRRRARRRGQPTKVQVTGSQLEPWAKHLWLLRVAYERLRPGGAAFTQGRETRKPCQRGSPARRLQAALLCPARRAFRPHSRFGMVYTVYCGFTAYAPRFSLRGLKLALIAQPLACNNRDG